MSFYDDASLIMYPSGYKASKAYSLKPTDGSGDLTFTRASTATRVNESGLIESVATGVPRIDFTGAGCAKLLLEPQTTALNHFSEQINNAYWTLTRASAFGSGSVANAAISPDGTQSAEYIQQASGQTVSGGAFVGVLNSTGNYTISVFAKMAEQRYLRLGGALGTSGLGLFCNFDLQDGVIGTPSAGVTSKIENYGNGWYRCSITASKVDLTGVFIFLYQANTLNGSDATPLSGLYLWGANVTQTAYLQSYIPTLGTAVTRLADAAFKTGISSLIGQTEGVMFVDFYYDLANNTSIGSDKGIMTIRPNGGSSNNEIALIYYGDEGGSFGKTIQVYVTVGGAVQCNIKTPQTLTNGYYKVAFAYKQNDFAFYVNGTQIGTDNSGSVPTCDELYLVDPLRINPNTTIKEALLFPTRLTNTQLETLTTL